MASFSIFFLTLNYIPHDTCKYFRVEAKVLSCKVVLLWYIRFNLYYVQEAEKFYYAVAVVSMGG